MFRAPFAAIKALFAFSGWKVVGHPWWNAIELHLFSTGTALYFRFESSSSIYEACDIVRIRDACASTMLFTRRLNWRKKKKKDRLVKSEKSLLISRLQNRAVCSSVNLRAREKKGTYLGKSLRVSKGTALKSPGTSRWSNQLIYLLMKKDMYFSTDSGLWTCCETVESKNLFWK